MKVYFQDRAVGTFRLSDNDQAILNWSKKNNFNLLSDHVLTESTEIVLAKTHEQVVNFYIKFLKLVSSADIVIAEVSSPSTNVGHEISVALGKGKPVIVLYTKGNEPRFLTANPSDKLVVCEYDSDNLYEVLDNALDEAKSEMDVRFNFFISPRIGVYLDWISKFKKIPRAVFLRRLIEEDMNTNKEFKA